MREPSPLFRGALLETMLLSVHEVNTELTMQVNLFKLFKAYMPSTGGIVCMPISSHFCSLYIVTYVRQTYTHLYTNGLASTFLC